LMNDMTRVQKVGAVLALVGIVGTISILIVRAFQISFWLGFLAVMVLIFCVGVFLLRDL